MGNVVSAFILRVIAGACWVANCAYALGAVGAFRQARDAADACEASDV